MLKSFLDRHKVPVTSPTQQQERNLPSVQVPEFTQVQPFPPLPTMQGEGSSSPASKRRRTSSASNESESVERKEDKSPLSPENYPDAPSTGASGFLDPPAAIPQSTQSESMGLSNLLETAIEMEEKSGKKPERRKKKYFRPEPSRFCHICYRTNKLVRHVVCSNIAEGYCRKVICEKCIEIHGQIYNWDAEKIFENASEFLCSHCLNMCPDTAQCASYNRSNRRRTTRL